MRIAEMQVRIGRMTLEDMPHFWQRVRALVAQNLVSSSDEDTLQKSLLKRISTLISMASLNAMHGTLEILKAFRDLQMSLDGDTGPVRAFEVRFSYFVKHSSCSGDRILELGHLAKCHTLTVELVCSEWEIGTKYQQMVIDCIIDWVDVAPLSVCCACITRLAELSRADPLVFDAVMKRLMQHTQTRIEPPGGLALLAGFICGLSNCGLPLWSEDFENAIAQHLEVSISNWSRERLQDEIHDEGLVQLCQINDRVGKVVRAAFSKRLAKQARSVGLALKKTENVEEAKFALKDWTRFVQRAHTVHMLAFDSAMRCAILGALSECVEICMEPGGKLSECLEEVQRMQWNLMLLVGGNASNLRL